ncbi:MAG TPA: 2'-5' RNA ligase family protein [Solirubrobacteraceae bacterium]|nr:2'-5' RNA ligase family protein [Solirubrobacteraceae bacterium]
MTHTVRDVAWESAVVVRVPSLDETIAALRERFDLPRKPNGIPPHITAIVPFLPAANLTEAGALPALRSLCAAFEPFQVTFAATARFPNVLYLAPEPAEPFVALTRALVDGWPRNRPYAGEHNVVVPHLTVTTSRRRELFGTVSEALKPQLPLSATVDGAHVYLFDGRRWTAHAALPFGSSS